MLVLSLLLTVVVTNSKPHVYGPVNKAVCPVTGQNLTISASTPFVTFVKSSQKLYFVSKEAAEAYRQRPRAYWLSPFELPPAGKDGKRGLPDMHNQSIACAVDASMFQVQSMSSSRVMVRTRTVVG